MTYPRSHSSQKAELRYSLGLSYSRASSPCTSHSPFHHYNWFLFSNSPWNLQAQEPCVLSMRRWEESFDERYRRGEREGEERELPGGGGKSLESTSCEEALPLVVIMRSCWQDGLVFPGQDPQGVGRSLCNRKTCEGVLQKWWMYWASMVG